ncbi:hypothetical protein Acr_00g0035120 [Actinidia rufa]|uniref:Uncharacterized protein n=1 Tax=Actinidia rufa TaxID=165716 RepID=A0A7J0DH97_9ERIC|nr:hypothetical protein Acr_00g0035120 [Actinidia rufa]
METPASLPGVTRSLTVITIQLIFVITTNRRARITTGRLAATLRLWKQKQEPTAQKESVIWNKQPPTSLEEVQQSLGRPGKPRRNLGGLLLDKIGCGQPSSGPDLTCWSLDEVPRCLYRVRCDFARARQASVGSVWTGLAVASPSQARSELSEFVWW